MERQIWASLQDTGRVLYNAMFEDRVMNDVIKRQFYKGINFIGK